MTAVEQLLVDAGFDQRAAERIAAYDGPAPTRPRVRVAVVDVLHQRGGTLIHPHLEPYLAELLRYPIEDVIDDILDGVVDGTYAVTWATPHTIRLDLAEDAPR